MIHPMASISRSDAAAPPSKTQSKPGHESASRELRYELVVANHILFDQGIVDGFGHVSVRHDRDPQRFLLARNMAPGQVGEQDILEFGLDGAPLNADGRTVYLERFIHSEIYRARPDAMAIVHSHSHSIVPLSISKTARLRAVFHMAGFIGQEAPLFEIRDVVGSATDLLISNPALGAALARCCGDHNIVLMRGHGSTVIGPSLREAVYRAVYAELNARYQCEAMKLGEIVCLSKEEGEAAIRNIEQQTARAWNLWREEAARKRAPTSASNDGRA
jgi:ribulose-5-phosphate 4-epimerase/fuculose-1-phosphate aldolase